ncbi:hypothetical protein IMSHALPRED_001518 [Imshaugia aleurites]|uniref:Tetratricopeptide repeat domain-containing protein n=1 Tax=Imshaugia aleurites TaxID=172621 RepID=A0A8H3EWN9_9LECA|nr:hypothetical protein IMSHALPRED_001518 [Imshaugia aleurites]
MVLKSFTHIGRQSYSKVFSHGYVQSVVAAGQTSQVSTNTHLVSFGKHSSNRHGRPQSAQLHTSFHNASNASDAAGRAAHGSANGIEGYNETLVPYFEAWQQAQIKGKTWKQYQFAKRIGWEERSVLPDEKGDEVVDLGPRSDVLLNRGGLDRAVTASAVDDIKLSQDQAAEAEAVAKVNEAIANEIVQIQRSATSRDQQQTVAASAPQEEDLRQFSVNNGRSSTPSSLSAVVTVDHTARSTPISDVTAASSVQETESQILSEQLGRLHENELYSQIPPMFESMLARGLRPTVKAYNALLASATSLPIAKHQVVSKALDVYSDMLQRTVAPDTAFYTTLIQSLSRRALDVFAMKSALDEKLLRFNGNDGERNFLFASNEAEYKILAEDDALRNAVKIFTSSTSSQKICLYPAETYHLLITACALNGQVEDMIRAYSHMESLKIEPIAATFPPMIEAFAKSGDLGNAVECYNGYKALAIADDTGHSAIIDRKDNDVYAAVVKAYVMCGRVDGGHRFFARVVDSLADVAEYRKERLEAVQDTVVLNALVAERLNALDFSGALRVAEERSLTPSVRREAMSRICTAAADHDDVNLATKAYQYLSSTSEGAPRAAVSMLALHIRQGSIDIAGDYWGLLTASSKFDTSFVEPTTLYATALIRKGRVDEGLMQAREGFGRIRASAGVSALASEVVEEIDEAIEFIGAFLAKSGVTPAPNASMSFLWAMVENGGLVSPVAEQMLAGLGPEAITSLSWQDMTLALQVEGELLGSGQVSHDAAHLARFSHLFDIAISSGAPLDERKVDLIEKALVILSHERPDLFSKWQHYRQLPTEQTYHQRAFTPQPTPAVSSVGSFTDSYDPHGATTDYRGSTNIVEELENHRNSAGLNEALMRFRNIRRAGRHPRYIAYSKLISAAAKEGRTNLIHDILGMARHDVPFLPQYSVVRHGWSSILDAMVGACLTLGRRTLAAQFHQEMLEMGTAPTANTFGLYITTLKESTKTFDEASEAVAIFGRAIAEGVTPSSFLYNALIGKLGKARRIDDCLRYFQEMRAAGIRPTSVTYGTVVNALCRVSDDRFAEELFDEMESMPNYKPRPAPYNSLMQFFLTTKRDSQKVLSYYNRMQSRNIQPTMHTYKLLIDTHATLEPVNLAAAEGVLDTIRASGQRPEAVHYASLIHAKGCALHDMEGARRTFDEVLCGGEIRPQACLYQALFESMVANHCVSQTEEVLDSMSANRVEMTPYIANTLIHGWAMENMIDKSKAVYDSVGMEKREPSTYESMTRAFLTAEDRDGALATVHEMLSRGYPSAVSNKILELVGHGVRAGSVVLSELIA